MNISNTEANLIHILEVMEKSEVSTFKADFETLLNQVKMNKIDDNHLDRVRLICSEPKGVRDIYIPGLEAGAWDVKIFDLLDALDF